jgi:hypothetical protein
MAVIGTELMPNLPQRRALATLDSHQQPIAPQVLLQAQLVIARVSLPAGEHRRLVVHSAGSCRAVSTAFVMTLSGRLC